MNRKSHQEYQRAKQQMDEAFTRHEAYQDAVLATQKGRRSDALRNRGHRLVGAGQHAEAFLLYREARDVHDANDRSPAAAAAMYDLAEGYQNRQTGSREENLRSAIRMYGESLECALRREDWLRHALTLDGSARAHRVLAKVVRNPLEAATALAVAETRAREAITMAERCGFAGEVAAASYTLTFANTQYQLGRVRRGLEALRAAERRVLSAESREQDPQVPSLLGNIRRNLAERYLQAGGRPNRKRALKLLSKILAEAPMELHPQARVLLAKAHLAAGKPELALEALSKIPAHRLPPAEQQRYCDLLVRAGDTDAALRHLYGALHQLIRARTDALADQASDVISAQAQLLARTIASLHHGRGEALKGFLALDEVVGLRFEDAVCRYLWAPNTPVLREAATRHSALAGACATLDDIASWVRQLSVGADPRDVVGAQIAEIKPTDDTTRLDVTEILAALEAAHAAPDVAASLESAARTLSRKVMSLNARLDSLDPTRTKAPPGPGFSLSEETVDVLFADDPGRVVVHIDLQPDGLLAFAAWPGGDGVLARSLKADLEPGDWWPVLAVASGASPEIRSAADTFVRSVDMSSLYPTDAMERDLILVPSGFARFLPLGALGPEGDTPIDRFASVTWLPNVAPLRSRQATHPPRSGRVVVAPAGTQHADLAFGVGFEGEVLLKSDAATLAAVQDASRSADVLTLYSHGHHRGEGGTEIQLADGVLSRSRLGGPWRGMERIELWACESGVDWPHDPRTPFVDETFGLDGELLSLGVRSAIGTLWSVPDLVTAVLVRRYRGHLAEGVRADRALLRAQRWWRSEGIGALVEELRRQPAVAAMATFAASLSSADELLPESLLAVLGPVAASDEPMLAAELDAFEASLRSPLSWAGYRFLGVCEKRPDSPWTPEHERALTPGEEAEVDELMNVFPREAYLDEAMEDVLKRETAAALPEGAFTAAKALTVARLYRDRLVASHRHNLIRGLAWLHEAMERGVGTPDERRELLGEAVHLWLQLAIAFVGLPALKDLAPMPGRPLDRAAALLARLPQTEERGARALLRVLQADHSSVGPTVRAIAEGFPTTEVSEGPTARNHFFSWSRDLHQWATAIAFATKEAPDVASVLIVATSSLAMALPGALEYTGSEARLVADAALLEAKLSPGSGLARDTTARLTAPEQVALEFVAMNDLNRDGVAAGDGLRRRVSQALGFREEYVFGVPKDDRTKVWLGTGRTGAAYRLLTGSFIGGSAANSPGDALGAHFIASMQYMADLRLSVLKRWRCLFGADPEAIPMLPMFWWRTRDREASLDLLVDVAVLPDRVRIEGEEGLVEAWPGRLDPFEKTSEALKSECAGHEDVPAWLVGEAAEWNQPHEPARTAAFEIARSAELVTEELVQTWTHMVTTRSELVERGEVPPDEFDLRAFADLGLSLEENQHFLESIPPGYAVIGVALSWDQSLVFAGVWHGKDGREERVRILAGDEAFRVRSALAEAVQPEFEELTAGEKRRDAWRTISSTLDPLLTDLLSDARDSGARNLAVFAPGALRPLPWSALTLDQHPLYQQFATVIALPDLNWFRFQQPPDSADPAGHLVVEDPTEVGPCVRAVAATLQRWFPPHAKLRGPNSPTTDIPEADQLERIGPTLAELMLIGGDSNWRPVDAATGLGLDGGRTFSPHNTRGAALSQCRQVQIWAATSSLADIRRVLGNYDDRIPGLARSLLMCGAGAALDLAWPVPDPLRALVCERFNLLQRRGAGGADALAHSLREVRRELEVVRGGLESGQGTEFAFGGMDVMRYRSAEEAGVDPRAIVPFAGQLGRVPEAWKTALDIVDDLLAPVHWAAFRWWGT